MIQESRRSITNALRWVIGGLLAAAATELAVILYQIWQRGLGAVIGVG